MVRQLTDQPVSQGSLDRILGNAVTRLFLVGNVPGSPMEKAITIATRISTGA
jgi:hypothetical protein